MVVGLDYYDAECHTRRSTSRNRWASLCKPSGHLLALNLNWIERDVDRENVICSRIARIFKASLESRGKD